MIRWCAYCQKLLGERPPLGDASITHGACVPCADRLVDGEAPTALELQRLDYFQRLFVAASQADEATCRGLLDEGLALVANPGDLLIGLLQPVLAKAGHLWERGAITVAEEHRLSHWCQVFLSLLPLPAVAVDRLDLLMLVAPGNTHTAGPRIGAYALGQRGYSCRMILPSLPDSEVLEEALQLRPRFVGLSCALPAQLEAADRLAGALQARGFAGGVLLGGQAVRRRGVEGVATTASGAVLVATLEEAEALLR